MSGDRRPNVPRSIRSRYLSGRLQAAPNHLGLRSRAFEAGVQDFLAKPLSLAKLQLVCDKALQLRQIASAELDDLYPSALPLALGRQFG